MNELRQNWHITEMMCGWKNERENNRDYTRRAISRIEEEAAEKIEALEAELKAKVKEINAEKEVAILAERHALQECLLSIAKREDKYMSDFRNYVASLPEADRIAFGAERRQK